MWAGQLWIVFIKAPEGQAVSGAIPKRVVILEAPPESFMLASISEVAEEGIDILEADPLGEDSDHGDPSMAFSSGQGIKDIFIRTDQFLLAKGQGRREIFGGIGGPEDWAATQRNLSSLILMLENKVFKSGCLVGPRKSAAFVVNLNSFGGVEIEKKVFLWEGS